MSEAKKETEKEDEDRVLVKYFILRNPIERGYREFLHYSRNLKSIGQVNHLILSQLSADFEADNPEHYFSLEVNRNPYCKFLLERCNFSLPVEMSDIEDFLRRDWSVGPARPVFDDFSSLSAGTGLPTLSKILGKESIELKSHRQVLIDKKGRDVPENIRAIIERYNAEDIYLVGQLLLKSSDD